MFDSFAGCGFFWCWVFGLGFSGFWFLVFLELCSEFWGILGSNFGMGRCDVLSLGGRTLEIKNGVLGFFKYSGCLAFLGFTSMRCVVCATAVNLNAGSRSNRRSSGRSPSSRDSASRIDARHAATWRTRIDDLRDELAVPGGSNTRVQPALRIEHSARWRPSHNHAAPRAGVICAAVILLFRLTF